MATKIHHYESAQVEVTYDAQRCIHAAECVKRLGEVFDPQKRPWVQPEHATADAIATTIHACPSGALHYTRKDGGAEEPVPTENTITLVENGPLYVRGDVTLIGADDSLLTKDTRVALCRCGQSQHKPYCDNSHKALPFQASAEVIDTLRMEVQEIGSGPLEIKANPSGPLRFTGKTAIINGEGEAVFQAERQFLCRCGYSSKKPFCDGTHKQVGFTTE
jgi:CDGSH-type Zn-finger protein/uncharacterized Fe-S cluster protein YjdI